jgi:hypothetical protein
MASFEVFIVWLSKAATAFLLTSALVVKGPLGFFSTFSGFSIFFDFVLVVDFSALAAGFLSRNVAPFDDFSLRSFLIMTVPMTFLSYARIQNWQAQRVRNSTPTSDRYRPKSVEILTHPENNCIFSKFTVNPASP